ncbi:MAG: helix-turn-helix transcriptional regulator [Clostridiales bacterium]|nr:helix-turn-helix transcriptional regulator [Clostridiales bacterium]
MYADNFKQVGKNISLAMEKRGITQQQLADRLGISKQVMSKIINGEKAINVAELSQIATLLGSSADDLLSIKNNYQEHMPEFVFMGAINNEEAQRNTDLLRNAIDEIHLLEGLLNE